MIRTFKPRPNLNEVSVKQNAILALVIGVGVFLRYEYMAGSFVGGDELYYIRRIIEILQGELDTSTFRWYDYRIMIYMPQALFNFSFGFSPFTIILWPFIASILHIFIVYKISILIFNDFRTSIFSAIIFCFSPLNVVEIRLMPDALFSFFLSLTIYFLIRSSKALNSKARLYYTVVSSICLVLCFFIRENAFLIIPLLIIYIICDKNSRSFYFKYSVSFVALTLLLFFLLAATDILNVFTRFAALWNYFLSDHAFRGVGQIPYFPYFNYLFHPNINGYWITTIMFTGMAFLVYLRDKQSLIPIVWFVSIYLYFEFISPLHALRPAEGSFRYFMPFVAPSAIISGRFLDRWIVSSQSKDSNLQNIFITISLLIFILLQNITNNYVSVLIPIGLLIFLVFSKSKLFKKNNLKNSTSGKEIKIFKYLSPVFLSVSLVISISYISVASYGYDKITHNKIAASIYADLCDEASGLIASNEYLLERKINLFLNGVLHERSEFDGHHYDYIVTLNDDLLRTSYKTEKNDPVYNTALYSALNPDQYIIRESTQSYKIYSLK